MLSYYISQSNEFVVRTQDTASLAVSGSDIAEDMTLVLEDMMTYSQSFYPLSGSVSGSIYSGTMQVYASQSIDKVVYLTQNEEFISNTTDNDYIVI